MNSEKSKGQNSRSNEEPGNAMEKEKNTPEYLTARSVKETLDARMDGSAMHLWRTANSGKQTNE